jgi:molybdopterin-guanine dinucleotide biosynthesis protein A
MAAPVDLIVLAGGRGSRLDGALKPAVEVAGRTLLSRVLDARGFARRIVVVGPDSARSAAGRDGNVEAPDLLWALEDPPFGGPAAGLVAGLAALEHQAGAQPDAGWVLLLACDLPWAADAAGLLVPAATDPGLPATVHGLHLVDGEGRAQWLAGIYRTKPLRDAADRLGPDARGASMRDLLAPLSLRGLRDDAGAGSDVDTWQDVERSTTLLDDARTDPSRSDTE